MRAQSVERLCGLAAATIGLAAAGLILYATRHSTLVPAGVLVVPAGLFIGVGAGAVLDRGRVYWLGRILLWVCGSLLIPLTLMTIFDIGLFLLPGTLFALAAMLASGKRQGWGSGSAALEPRPKDSRPSRLLVGAAALSGGAAGFVSLSSLRHGGEPLLGLLELLWVALLLCCGLFVRRAPWASAREVEAGAVAALMLAMTLSNVPQSGICLPGCVLWLIVLAHSDWGESAGAFDRFAARLRRSLN